MVDDASEDEQQIRQPVDVLQQNPIDRRIERNDAAFGAAADGAGDVKRCAGRSTAGQDEAAQRGQFGFETIDQRFEPPNMIVGNHGFGHTRRQFVRRIGELRAERKQIALDLHRLAVEIAEA